MPIQPITKCHRCGHDVITKYDDGKHKLRTNIVIFEPNGSVIAKCPNCKADVRVPVALQFRKKTHPPNIIYGDKKAA